ncbi:hypothetical protein ACE939_00615 [Aquimarina sp. W85]|uniref:hypothetical protein n=1 Tax=Aquimarina rhodophyticola TaxID=3342246 RepID=UPI00366B58C4
MEVYAYCFMPSHVHFVFRSGDENPKGLIQDFKKHTAKKLIEAVQENPQESRKEWLLWMIEKVGAKNASVCKIQFWQHHNQPVEFWTNSVIQQKIAYIHNNPVVSGFVTDAVD